MACQRRILFQLGRADRSTMAERMPHIQAASRRLRRQVRVAKERNNQEQTQDRPQFSVRLANLTGKIHPAGLLLTIDKTADAGQVDAWGAVSIRYGRARFLVSGRSANRTGSSCPALANCW